MTKIKNEIFFKRIYVNAPVAFVFSKKEKDFYFYLENYKSLFINLVNVRKLSDNIYFELSYINSNSFNFNYRKIKILKNVFTIKCSFP